MPNSDAIKQALRDCRTPVELERVADTHRDAVRALYADPDTKTMAIQIANLKAYRLWEMRNPK